jgi:hypothetical protein
VALSLDDFSSPAFVAADADDEFLRACSDLQSLLSDPNPNSPANSEAARLYSENR